MSKKRAAWYVVAAVFLSLGFFITLIVYLAVKSRAGFRDFEDLVAPIATLIPFALPGAGILTYLLLTEKKRLKPWAAAISEEAAKQNPGLWADPGSAARFRMFSGAIWIFAVAVFLLVGLLAGFRYSWPVFFIAAAGRLLLKGFMSKK